MQVLKKQSQGFHQRPVKNSLYSPSPSPVARTIISAFNSSRLRIKDYGPSPGQHSIISGSNSLRGMTRVHSSNNKEISEERTQQLREKASRFENLQQVRWTVFSIQFQDNKQGKETNLKVGSYQVLDQAKEPSRAQNQGKQKSWQQKQNMNNSMSELDRQSQYYGPIVRGPINYERPMVSRGEYNHHQMKQLVDEMRFKEKMEAINKKKGKYKRSTNNCHKKYIGIAKNLVCLKMEVGIKEAMVTRFFQYRNSRVYYFIILSFLKWHLSVKDIHWVFEHFCLEVGNKIERYQMEINITSNSNFIHFRGDQILEMKFSIQSIHLFLTGHEEESIRLLYQKNKYIIIKKNQYLKTLQIIRQLTRELELTFPEVNIRKKEQELHLEYVHPFTSNDFHIPYASHMPHMPSSQFYPMNPEREWTFLQGPSEPNGFMKQEAQAVGSEERDDSVMVKEEVGEQSMKKFPLLVLENSYPVIDYLNWHSWLINKQKRLEFYVKSKEQSGKAQGFPLASPQ